jgi:hypothetical protein
LAERPAAEGCSLNNCPSFRSDEFLKYSQPSGLLLSMRC